MSIIWLIVKADKGNTVVILYKKSYDEKMLTILNDRSKFESVSEENTLDRLKKLTGLQSTSSSNYSHMGTRYVL